jgi:ABC-2 type transport system permease protein
MRSVLTNEILKTFSKWRSSIAFIAIAVVVPLVHIAFYLQGEAAAKSLARGLTQDFFLLGNLLNGYFVTYVVLNTLWIHVPFLITLGAGDQLAGEATGGTFRLLLIRPVSRTRAPSSCSWAYSPLCWASHCSAPATCWCPVAPS